MEKPVILVVDTDPHALRQVEEELSRRYAADYAILCETSPPAALARLEGLKRAGGEAAILLADCRLPGMSGADFLQQAHRWYPQARRGLLVNWGNEPAAAALIVEAMALDRIDGYAPKPVTHPDEEFHSVIGEFLTGWAWEHRPPFEAFRIVGEPWALRSHELRDLFNRNGIQFSFYDVHAEAGHALLEQAGQLDAPLPVLIRYDGRVLADPTNEQIASALGVPTGFEPAAARGGEVVDVVVVGAGPAGLSAAVNAASEGLRTVVVEREALGGQAGMSARIRNYLGFPTGIAGDELAARAYRQAWLFGSEFIFTKAVTGLEVQGSERGAQLGSLRTVVLSDGSRIPSRAVVLAMGAAYRRLEIPALERLVGAGVYYGAVGSETLAVKGREVFVVGGANAAGQAALHLARYADRVTLLVRGVSLANSMSEYLIQEIDARENLQVRLNTRVTGGGGEDRLESLVVEDRTAGRTETLPAAGLFVMIGAKPHTAWLPPSIQRDPAGYIWTGLAARSEGPPLEGWPLKRGPLLLETSLPGVLAAGDVRHGSVKRIASAVGEGAMAVQLLHQYFMG